MGGHIKQIHKQNPLIDATFRCNVYQVHVLCMLMIPATGQPIMWYNNNVWWRTSEEGKGWLSYHFSHDELFRENLWKFENKTSFALSELDEW